MSLPHKPTQAQVVAARAKIVAAARNMPDNTAVRFLQGPFDGERSAQGFEIDPMARDMCRGGQTQESVPEIAVANGYTKEEILDRMLSPLHDALLLCMSEKCSKDDVSNMHSCEIWWRGGGLRA